MVEVIEMVAADEAGAEQPWLDVAWSRYFWDGTR
tara:strand:- start:644 stop:745 length:102 start_codon:yes stop_codon:yes gene_type:complete